MAAYINTNSHQIIARFARYHFFLLALFYLHDNHQLITSESLLVDPFPEDIVDDYELRHLASLDFPLKSLQRLNLGQLTPPEYVHWIANQKYNPDGMNLSQYIYDKVLEQGIDRLRDYHCHIHRVCTINDMQMNFAGAMDDFDPNHAIEVNADVGRDAFWHYHEYMDDVDCVLRQVSGHSPRTTEGLLLGSILKDY
jgi:hypothetical protein